MKVLLIYASKKGQTAKIIAVIQRRLQQRGHEALVLEAGSRHSSPWAPDLVIAGAPVYAGRFPRKFLRWVKRNRALLHGRPSAFFSVTLNAADSRAEARKDDDRLLKEFAEKSGWVPDYLASFAGALKYLNYNWLVRRMMKGIAAKAGGDTDTSRNYEYTDWQEVEAFLEAILQKRQDTPFATGRRLPELSGAKLPLQDRALGLDLLAGAKAQRPEPERGRAPA